MKPEIKLTTAENIIGIRHHVLRTGKPISTCYFEGDQLLSSFHFGAFLKNKIIGCVSLMPKPHPLIEDKNTYQLRGMAVLPNFRGQKIGEKLLYKAEEYLKSIKVKTLWCNVRLKAIGFYGKNNFQIISDEFQIPEVGSHVLMLKEL